VLNESEKKLLIDCRPREQYNIVHFEQMPNVVHIPLQDLRFMNKDGIENRIKQAQSDHADKSKLYVFCRSGVTSQQAVIHLNDLGFNSFNITKGMVGYKEYSGYEFSALL